MGIGGPAFAMRFVLRIAYCGSKGTLTQYAGRSTLRLNPQKLT